MQTMNSAAIRQQLHHFIDVADDSKIIDLLQYFKINLSNEKYTAAQLDEFYNRLDRYENGEMPVYTIEEAHNYVRTTKTGK